MGKAKKPVEQVVEQAEDKGIEIFTESDANLVVEAKDDDLVNDVGVPDEDNGRSEIYKKYDEKRNADAGVVADVANDVAPGKPVEVSVLVNGRERMVLQSKIDDAGGKAAYQKNAAASETLNQAKEYERAVNARALELQAFERQLLAEQKNLSARQAPDQAALRGLAEKYNEALINGETQEATELMLQMQGAHHATPVDMEAISAHAVRRAKQEFAQEHQQRAADAFKSEQQSAVQRFLDEDTDISGDPRLSNMTDAETIVLQTAHPDWGAGRIIEEATKNVRHWVSTKFGSAPDKLSVKRSIDTVRGGSARAIARPTPKPQSGSDYINALRKQRGLE